jgi:hypothetical protein
MEVEMTRRRRPEMMRERWSYVTLEAPSSDGTSSKSRRNGRAEKEAAAAAMAGAERVRSTMVANWQRWWYWWWY